MAIHFQFTGCCPYVHGVVDSGCERADVGEISNSFWGLSRDRAVPDLLVRAAVCLRTKEFREGR